MPLECVMILLDNSLYARNADAIPNRFQCQFEGINSLINHKSNDNAETSIGLMMMAGKGKQILVTPTNETVYIFSQYNKIQIQDFICLSRAIQIAQLTMKHRVNKNQHERIVVFVASVIKETPEELYVIAGNLRKNMIAVDIVNICCQENVELLHNFVEIVNVDSNSRFVNFQGGLGRLGDALKQSGILGGHQTDTGTFQEDIDPELEMVLRISLEEERKRQEEIERSRQPANQETKMEMEDTKNDEEQSKLLSKANEIVNDQSSKQPTDSKNNEYLNDPNFINDILQNLKIDKKDEDQPDDKNKKQPKK